MWLFACVGGLLAYIQQTNSLSLISAVFDDGDEKTLRRSSLCLKGARHFAESEASIVLSSQLSRETKLILFSHQQSHISAHSAQIKTYEWSHIGIWKFVNVN